VKELSFAKGKLNGLSKFYKNGKIDYEADLAGFEDESRRVGRYVAYYENGNKKEEGSFKNEEKNGKWTFYHPSGAKQSEGEFKFNDKNGSWQEYDEAGNPLSGPVDYILGEKK
jgi:antitoxin component YwqK of YwqJK toxin-antitoxin module